VLVADRVLLAKRVPWPIGGEQNSPQVGMAFKQDPEHVVNLALHPVRSRPDCGDRWARFAVNYRQLQTHSAVLGDRVKEQNYIELLALPIRPMDGSQIGAHFEIRVVFVMKKATQVNVCCLLNSEYLLAEC